MAGGDPLGPSAGCPLAGRCEACGTTRALKAAAYQTPVGVFCATVCRRCVAAGNPPPVRSWGQACERVGAHCQHLDIDLDQMADLLHSDAEKGREQVTDPARALGQHARHLLAEARRGGSIPSLPVGLAGRWALATWRALAGSPGRGSGGGRAHQARLLDPEAVCWS